MRKMILAGLLAWLVLVCPLHRVRAIQFSLPFVTQQSTTATNTSIVFTTNTLPSSSYMSCLQHVTAESNTPNAQFIIAYATVQSNGSIGAGATNYIVTLSSGLPYDSQWGNLGAWCAPLNTQMTLNVINGGVYTISCEQFTTKGWSP